MKRESDVPAPKLRWVNEDNALFYEIDESEGKGKRPYWVDRNDLRVKEPRSLNPQIKFVAKIKTTPTSKKKGNGTLIEDPSQIEKKYVVEEVPFDLLRQDVLEEDLRQTSPVSTSTSLGINEAEPIPGSKGILIKGDNLLALNSLVKQFENKPEEEKVKCIYVDIPYNTGSAFKHYEDNLEHSQWLTMLRDRLELLRKTLREDGSIWITVDDDESHYLKIVCDEVFGRECFIGSIIWQTTDNSNNNVTTFSLDHNYILVYGKNSEWKPNFLSDLSRRKHFKNPNNDPRGPWFDGNPVNNPGWRPNLQFELIGPKGDIINCPPNGWRWSKETIDEKLKTGELRFSEDGKRLIRRTYLNELEGLPPSTLWDEYDDLYSISSFWNNLEETGHNRQAKYELKNLFPEVKVTDLFSTPKPEKLLRKVFDIATNPGDLVLDCFAGSGTTMAVAHKMGRNWIGIEVGDHADTHIIPRLKKVISGEDQGGISETVGWKGGGSFTYYHLGESIISISGKTYDFNWKLSVDEISRAVLYYFEYIESTELKVKNFLFGTKADGSIGIVHIRNSETERNMNLTELELNRAFDACKQLKGKGKIRLFTNCGVQGTKGIEVVKVPTEIVVELE
ncbi:MAG: site-specific DNA-methyltransferase [Leptospiraceae bacterium]|nr:site-specific DNA-methyltransferase [Leptospiraceae bacterium]